MAVRFQEIAFHNESGIEVALTIEAPRDSIVVRSHPVGPNSSYRVSPALDNCKSCLLEVSAAHHGVTQQLFATSESSVGLPTFLQSVVARHVVGSSIRGSFTAGNS